ncbi:MAG: hypothetical protein HYX21_02315 [Candidatus Yanofskybacteria bacterium]|nr:hypothetical protein [Candidatus Yanofskybacteria bacterium]
MKPHTKIIITFLTVIFVFNSGIFTKPSFAASKSQESPQQEPVAMTIKIVDGFFHHLDLEKKLMYVAIDKDGKVLQSINLRQIESVYLIQGRPEKLKGLLTGGSIGAVIGFSSLFWRDVVGLNKNDKTTETADKNGNRINIADLAIRIGGGAGVGLLVGYFGRQGEDDIRPFPVYDPSIKQTNPHPSINFGDIGNLSKMLREKESFVHVTLKEREEK